MKLEKLTELLETYNIDATLFNESLINDNLDYTKVSTTAMKRYITEDFMQKHITVEVIAGELNDNQKKQIIIATLRNKDYFFYYDETYKVVTDEDIKTITISKRVGNEYQYKVSKIKLNYN